MEREVNISQTVEVGYDDKGHFKIVKSPDLLPAAVVEQLLNMTAETTIQRLVESDAKGITTELMTNVIANEHNKELKMWRFISYVSLIVIAILIAKLKGLI